MTPEELEKVKTEEEKIKKLNEREASIKAREEAFQERELRFKRNQLIALGYPEEKAKTKKSMEVLDELIEEYEGRQKTEKKNEEPQEDDPQTAKTNVQPIHPNTIFPSNITKPVEKPYLNDGSNKLFLYDPQNVSRTVVLIGDEARLNVLFPDDDHPYPRVIA